MFTRLLTLKFWLQKKISDMVHGFDQVQVEKMGFFIVFCNINSKYKPMDRETPIIISLSFFLSPSWRLCSIFYFFIIASNLGHHRHNSKHTAVAITGRCGPIRHNKRSCVEFAQSAEIRAILTAHAHLIKCRMRQRF